jgi:hypothetical protein
VLAVRTEGDVLQLAGVSKEIEEQPFQTKTRPVLVPTANVPPTPKRASLTRPGSRSKAICRLLDVATQYRNLGGNLAFLAANNFFWKITIKNHVMTRVAQWRDLVAPKPR